MNMHIREDKKIKEGKSQQKKQRLSVFVCLFETERELCFVVGRNGRRERVSLWRRRRRSTKNKRRRRRRYHRDGCRREREGERRNGDI